MLLGNGIATKRPLFHWVKSNCSCVLGVMFNSSWICTLQITATIVLSFWSIVTVLKLDKLWYRRLAYGFERLLLDISLDFDNLLTRNQMTKLWKLSCKKRRKRACTDFVDKKNFQTVPQGIKTIRSHLFCLPWRSYNKAEILCITSESV